ncbi:MAG: glutamate synthase large subunit, partial [Thermodesulfovibrionales bacterium]
IFHQRFSTNTSPDWRLSQPLRAVAHNGEINTIQGNRNWMAAIGHELRHELFGNGFQLLQPLVSPEESDSASLDRVVELLIRAGFPPEQAITLCIPPAWEQTVPPGRVRAFLRYQSLLMKPWDGPAAVVFTDGEKIGAHLDRNGLRPLRYTVTEDDLLLLGSETGMVELGERGIKERGRLGPGETLCLDPAEGRLVFTDEILMELSDRKPYGEWLKRSPCSINNRTEAPEVEPDLVKRQIAFGYTAEETETAIKEMAETGREITFSMGDDTPLPPLSERPQLLYRYFRERFSQVTNPPIDPLREKSAMSLTMNLGHKRNFIVETPEQARRLPLSSPVICGSQVRDIEAQDLLAVQRLSITYDHEGRDLSSAVRELSQRVVDAVKAGAEIIILSDRDLSREKPAIPALLALSASFHALLKNERANRTSFIMETGEARDVHHMACLIGHGASAVHPYLLYETAGDLCGKGILSISPEEATAHCRKALEEGILKVMAKMGISTLNSYHGARLFDIICLKKKFTDEYFPGALPCFEADGIGEIEASLMKRHHDAFFTDLPALPLGGEMRSRKGGEWHAWSPQVVIAMNRFIKSREYQDYKDFSRLANERPVSVRHLLGYKKGTPLPIGDVEPEEEILKHFFSGAMSVGALSPEAHETIAEACNRLGMRSNSGEGGEDPRRYGGTKNSAIKQIASGRFGVTPAYLASAAELEIKMAQGAKPGEGGHLPAGKVTEYIGSLRHCRPKTLLISPPPHHDIYSIEDLAQLINDLKQANPLAKVCVKLVSELGVGTVAAGVAKAYADIIQVCGCEGGTGAASLSSIKNAGNYWELGLSETQRVLVENGLRDRVLVRVDGGIRTGRDIIIAALLGAEEYGFGTATMLAGGCVMARQCHLNTCPRGVATQDERLRGKFSGTTEGIMAYFRSVAREVREILSEMGVKSLNEIIGKTDLITRVVPEGYAGAGRMRLDELTREYPAGTARKRSRPRNDNPSASMNNSLVAELLPFIEKAEPVERSYAIRNVDRSIPVQLNYHISRIYGNTGLPPNTITLRFHGTAGQSFGAFNHKGLSLFLTGEANDYVGKGMYGGRIVISNPEGKGESKEVIAGNTLLYGATGGEFFAAGTAGERFCVRNSGAVAVVEGAGDHLCEYMTGGTVLVLGEAGSNIGA